ncbi:hypothetical protein [Antarctobacter sp.]|uniref:hypothetical protein n=1 Tax=Antarctobacter sp. TaxID=1872577 RepID=UPI002B27B940|nr:hypothetical protein [Antarctobacter sp.]
MEWNPAARLAASLALGLTCTTPAAAEEPLDLNAVRACVSTAIDLGNKPTGCVDSAHSACLRVSSETPAVAALCFEEARAQWSDAIGTRMEHLRDAAPERIAALAGIELKYDLLSSLVQCDRMEELALLREIPAEEIRTQKSRCTATASGLAYIRLLWRLPDPNPITPEEKQP